MRYDPIKDSLDSLFDQSVFTRKIFYRLLDLILLRTWHMKREIRKWKKTAPENAHILDAGSGFGQYAYFLSRQKKNWNILGVDVKRNYVAECNEFFRATGKQNVFFRMEDLTRMRNEDTFDLIISVDVMEHIADDEAVFRNFFASLRHHGVLLMAVPSNDNRPGINKKTNGHKVDEHVRDGYDKHDLKEKLKRAGFHHVKVHYSYGIPGKIAWKFASKWPLTVLGLSRFFIVLLPFYYSVFILPIIVLHYLDTWSPHRTGAGLIVKASK
ncbi:MAG: class I SAM-dependent methyltransferase [Bacteroidota bacterium]